MVGVNWEEENFFEGTHQQSYNVDPPGYEEALEYPTVSSWDENQKNKPQQLITQYSLRLNPMVSSSESESQEVPETQNMLSYPRQPSTNPDMSI